MNDELTVMRRIPRAVLLAILCAGWAVMTERACSQVATKASDAPGHRELGMVRWQRDFDAARTESRKTGKPILILFDEVPGCNTCVSFGETVLSHPLIVEAAEDLFVPVAIFNNVEGADRLVLTSFKEPQWNNPVVRVVDAERRELAPRVDSDYSRRGLIAAMTAALTKIGHPVPEYLALFALEVRAAASSAKAVFAMHCFWEGEAKLGALDGVLATRTGFQSGNEVVEVTYDPSLITAATLSERAREMACSSASDGGTVTGSTKDDKYRLRQTHYAALPMTEAQASRINAALGAGKDPASFLSPRQLALAERMVQIEPSNRPCFIGRSDLATAWAEAQRAAAAK